MEPVVREAIEPNSAIALTSHLGDGYVRIQMSAVARSATALITSDGGELFMLELDEAFSHPEFAYDEDDQPETVLTLARAEAYLADQSRLEMRRRLVGRPDGSGSSTWARTRFSESPTAGGAAAARSSFSLPRSGSRPATGTAVA